MVPAALIDADGEAILDAALDMADALEPSGRRRPIQRRAPSGRRVRRGRAGRAATSSPSCSSRSLASFGLWLEQLVAESTGKHGLGMVPVVGEPIDDDLRCSPARPPDRVDRRRRRHRTAPGVRRSDRRAVARGADRRRAPTCCCGSSPSRSRVGCSGNQPVRPARRGGGEGRRPGRCSTSAAPADARGHAAGRCVGGGRSGDCIARSVRSSIPGLGAAAALAEAVRDGSGRSSGWRRRSVFGPRFLHSTGQLHKGGPAAIVIAPGRRRHATGGRPRRSRVSRSRFDAFKAAQAAGDLEALGRVGSPRHSGSVSRSCSTDQRSVDAISGQPVRSEIRTVDGPSLLTTSTSRRIPS